MAAQRDREMLIVEDDAVLRKHLSRLFVREGYQVTTARTRTEALGELARTRFETLLLDVKLPDGDGFELLASLGDARRPCRTVMMTAYSTSENEARAQRLGVGAFLGKPLDLRQLIRVVRA
ncbi:MAG: response regulator [Candidatus Binatia bacterium]